MAILWMVPIYSVTSWLALVLPQEGSIFGAVRDCYEAYVVYTFIGLLIAVLEDGKGLSHLVDILKHHVVQERKAMEMAIQTQSSKPSLHMVPLFSCCECCYTKHKPSSVAAWWLYQCKFMVMQFVILKPFLAVLPTILELSHYDYENVPMFQDNSINWTCAKLYVLLVQNLSVAIAFYALLKFYHGTQTDLAWCDPWPKFLVIKGVVFFTFWQGVSIQVYLTQALQLFIINKLTRQHNCV